MNTAENPSLPVFEEQLSRPQAIERLRTTMKSLTDEENCMCTAASRLGIFCQGLTRLTDAEFRRRFGWIARKRPGTPREELERIVSLYHCGRQWATGSAICCDVETREHAACDGWNTFDNRFLEEFYAKLTGHRARIG